MTIGYAGTQDAPEPRVLDRAMHHLGDDETPEWSEAGASPEPGLEFTFRGRALPGESVLFVRQRNVNEPWHIEINGRRVATLRTVEELVEEFYVVPGGVLREGENRFELVGDVPTDDITFGDVRLVEAPLARVFDLRPVTVRVVDGDGAPLPARVTVLDSSGELATLFSAERLHTAVRKGVCYTDDGEARMQLPAGRYRVFATRGTEWSLGRATLEAGLEGADDPTLVLIREVDTKGYVAADTHVHTLTFSGHGDSSVEERMVTLAGEGIELAIATDHNHNTDYRPYQERMGLQRFFTPVVGNEVTTPIGHFNAFPLDPADEAPAHDLHEIVPLVEGIRAKGARVVILNHPRWPDHETGPYGKHDLGHFTGASSMEHPYDAIEVINSQTEEDRPMVLFEDWFSLLNRGEPLVAVASSDSHTVGGVVGMGRTYVRSSTDDPAAIDLDEACASFLSGRTSLSLGFFADVRVDGRHGMGDRVRVGEDGAIDLSITVRSASWIRPEQATVFVDGIPVAEVEVPSTAGEPVDVDLRLPDLALPAHDAWLVVLVRGAAVEGRHWPALNDYTLAVTNPVYLDRDGDGVYTPPRATAEKLLARHGSTPQAVAEIMKTTDETVDLHLLDLARAEYLRQAEAKLREAARLGTTELTERVRAFLDEVAAD